MLQQLDSTQVIFSQTACTRNALEEFGGRLTFAKVTTLHKGHGLLLNHEDEVVVTVKETSFDKLSRCNEHLLAQATTKVSLFGANSVVELVPNESIHVDSLVELALVRKNVTLKVRVVTLHGHGRHAIQAIAQGLKLLLLITESLFDDFCQ